MDRDHPLRGAVSVRIYSSTTKRAGRQRRSRLAAVRQEALAAVAAAQAAFVPDMVTTCGERLARFVLNTSAA